MTIKIAVVGIVVLAVIAVALTPSPGNLLYSPAESKSTGTFEFTETGVQAPVQNRQMHEAMIEPKSQMLVEIVTPPTTQQATESVPEPVVEPVYTYVVITPEEVVVTVNQTFKVEIWINNVTDMGGWQVGLLWNKKIIRCVGAEVNTPPEWGGAAFDWFNKTEADVNLGDVYTAWLFGSGVENDYSDTCGRYFKAECFGPRGGPYHNTYSGSILVITLTFQALQTGSSRLSFVDIVIGTGNAEAIGYTTNLGIVEVQSPLWSRSSSRITN